ncbi:MAG: hypothetical protein LBT59_22975 [Clostridiales bacterium]|nr:hypothetical protein [Clostridiales bacterium]
MITRLSIDKEPECHIHGRARQEFAIYYTAPKSDLKNLSRKVGAICAKCLEESEKKEAAQRAKTRNLFKSLSMVFLALTASAVLGIVFVAVLEKSFLYQLAAIGVIAGVCFIIFKRAERSFSGRFKKEGKSLTATLDWMNNHSIQEKNGLLSDIFASRAAMEHPEKGITYISSKSVTFHDD